MRPPTPVGHRSVVLGVGGVGGDFSHTGANRLWLVSRFYILYIIFFTLQQSASVLNIHCAVRCSPMSDAVISDTPAFFCPFNLCSMIALTIDFIICHYTFHDRFHVHQFIYHEINLKAIFLTLYRSIQSGLPNPNDSVFEFGTTDLWSNGQSANCQNAID